MLKTTQNKYLLTCTYNNKGRKKKMIPVGGGEAGTCFFFEKQETPIFSPVKRGRETLQPRDALEMAPARSP